MPFLKEQKENEKEKVEVGMKKGKEKEPYLPSMPCCFGFLPGDESSRRRAVTIAPSLATAKWISSSRRQQQQQQQAQQ